MAHIKIESFGRYDTGTPLVKEYFGSHPWIMFGEHNDFPQELIRLYQNSSPIHTALINRKTDMIAGGGFNEATPFIKNEYFKEDLNVIAKKVAFDKVLFGGFYLKLTWDKAFKNIARVEFLPYEKMRIAKYDCDSVRNPYKAEGFYFSKDWMNYRKHDNAPLFFPEYDVMLNEDSQFRKDHPSQVMFFRTYTPGLDYYTLPSYNSALNAIKTDYEISTWHLKNIQNGMSPKMIIVNKSGIPTSEEMSVINQEMEIALAGAENAGRFINVYAETADKAPEFITVNPTSSDQQFKDLRESIDSVIMRAHAFTSAIAGIETAGKLGTSAEIEEQLEYVQSTVISPMQMDIENAFMKIAKINGNDEVLTLKKYTIFNSGVSAVTAPTNTTNAASENLESPASVHVNENIKNLTAKQHQQLLRIIRQYGKGQITKEAAAVLLKTGLGLTDEDIASLLPDEE